jgi:hypothetical protein
VIKIEEGIPRAKMQLPNGQTIAAVYTKRSPGMGEENFGFTVKLRDYGRSTGV